MRVVLAMTASALGRQFEADGIGRGVAGFTLQTSMRPRQRITGLPAVIEAPMRPRSGVMALAAAGGGAESALVIAVLVARLARGRQFQGAAWLGVARLA